MGGRELGNMFFDHFSICFDDTIHKFVLPIYLLSIVKSFVNTF